MNNTNTQTTDLTQRPPRSPRVRLGGYAILPRMLDKCRAELGGENGEYHYACPLDQRFLNFAGVDSEKLKTEVAKGLGDGEILSWITANATNKLNDWEIAQWSNFREAEAPVDNQSRDLVKGLVADAGGADRNDLATWFEVFDFDDYVSFGGNN